MLQLMKASAGSGKTYSLARQYISLLLESDDRYAYRHILAVTFTNKATDEMKNRILKELYIMSVSPSRSGYRDWFIPSMFNTEDALQTKARRVLHDILHDYSAFAVSTIDKFFQQTLKAFSREIGQFASYQVELDKDSLIAESVDRILDSLTEDSGSLLAWLTENVLDQIEQGGRYNMDANLMDMAKRLKSPQRQELIEQTGVDPDKIATKESLTQIRVRCREICRAFRKNLEEKADNALKVLESAGIHPDESNRKFMSALYNFRTIDGTDPIVPPKDTFFSRAANKEEWFSKAAAKTLLPKVEGLLDEPLREFCEIWQHDYAVFNTAQILDGQLYGLGVAAELSKTFQELMKEKNVLCIDDSNMLLRDIIDGSDAPFVYEKLGVRFEHFLLDEFQDTSVVQWQNFRPLLANSESQGGKNLIVGDIKQSIYRWRGSDWKLLDEIVPAEFDDITHKVLDTNYRSLRNIVEFNNAFFKAAASVLDKRIGEEECGPLSRIYVDVAQKTSKKDKPGGSVKLTFCNADNELQEVLSAIQDALEAGARLSEIAVLVRSNAIGEKVASWLIENGFPVITDDSLKVRNALTVRRLVSLMSYIDNPEDTVSGYLAAMLDVSLPENVSSLVDMVECLYRNIRSGEDKSWQGELLHIQSFMDCVQEYASKNGNSLRGFLKYWEGEDPSISSPSSGDSVRVMTIHKSKGLDFPYVIIPYAESISLFKADNHWCRPDVEGTVLEDVADGIYDVTLSASSERSLFAEDFRKENFLQLVDNINTLYVAMTRPALGMHIIARMPSSDCRKAVDKGSVPDFKDFSQILYWYASGLGFNEVRRGVSDDSLWFETGDIVDFDALREDEERVAAFGISDGDEFPSVPLNPSAGEDEDVRVRGRLKFSADSLDFFREGHAGVAASERIRGIVLHDILSEVKVSSDLKQAVDFMLMQGTITDDEAEIIHPFLTQALESVKARGWFDENAEIVYNETSLIDTDGQIYRPDRVVICRGKVMIVDYKFGEHRRQYERQVKRYADIWRRMGYEDVSGYLWYVDASSVVEV